MSGDFHFKTIRALHDGYRAGTLDPTDVVSALETRADALDGRLHAYVTRFNAEARQTAEEAAKAFKEGGAVGPLTGVPIALKDLVDLDGEVTQGGSPAHAGRTAQGTATIAARLIEAGAVITGKTHTVEMAMGGWGTNEHLGTPWNPWDLAVHRNPGGSSSGSGVAVAAGMVPGAIGSDTGGSVRLPASFCGTVGLKVTEGRLPLDGIQPLSSTLDTPGPLTRCVWDAAVMYDIMTGRRTAEIAQDISASQGLYAEIDRPISGLRLGVLTDRDLEGHDDEVMAFYRAATECLAGLGATLVPFDLPEGHQDYAAELQKIISFEGYRFNRKVLEDETAKVDRWVRARLAPGEDMTESVYRGALETRETEKAKYAANVDDLDAVLTPTTRHPAIPVDQVDETTTPALTTRLANYLGLCGLALPNGITKAGLPSSLQVMCKPNDEIMALRVGQAYETANTWADRHPSL